MSYHDAAAETLLRHPFGTVEPGWCDRCGEHVCCCLSARPVAHVVTLPAYPDRIEIEPPT